MERYKFWRKNTVLLGTFQRIKLKQSFILNTPLSFLDRWMFPIFSYGVLMRIWYLLLLMWHFFSSTLIDVNSFVFICLFFLFSSFFSSLLIEILMEKASANVQFSFVTNKKKHTHTNKTKQKKNIERMKNKK